MARMTMGWLVYRIDNLNKISILGLYETAADAREDCAIMIEQSAEDWLVSPVPFIGWGHPKDLN